MELMFHDHHTEVEIKWSQPVALQALKGPEHENDLVYLITAKSSSGKEKLIYVGQAYSQRIADRIVQPDHRKKQKEWESLFPRHALQVRKGNIDLKNGAWSVAKINAIESMLIYCLDTGHCQNKRGNLGSQISGRFEIHNRGDRSSLPKKLGYGFYAEY